MTAASVYQAAYSLVCLLRLRTPEIGNILSTGSIVRMETEL